MKKGKFTVFEESQKSRGSRLSSFSYGDLTEGFHSLFGLCKSLCGTWSPSWIIYWSWAALQEMILVHWVIGYGYLNALGLACLHSLVTDWSAEWKKYPSEAWRKRIELRLFKPWGEDKCLIWGHPGHGNHGLSRLLLESYRVLSLWLPTRSELISTGSQKEYFSTSRVAICVGPSASY